MPNYYSVLSFWQIFGMTIALQTSSLFSLPIILSCFKRANTNFEGILFSMTLLASFMFHTCQIYQIEIFLSKGQWQRIDNIFTISSFEIVILHLCGAICGESLLLKLSAIFSTIIVQEKDPWNFAYTVAPLVTYLFVGISLHFYHRKDRTIIYKSKNMIVASLVLTVGCYFFIAGLDQDKDYLRLNHAAWHVFGSALGYFCLNAVEVTPNKSHIYKQRISPKQSIQ